MLYAGVMLYSLKKESDQIFSWYFNSMYRGWVDPR